MEVFNLDIIPGKAMPVIHCSQFDKGRAFRANLFERGAVYILNGAETLSIIEKKSDGNMVTISVTNTSDSFIEFEITEQMSAIAGPQLCELRIEEGGNVIGSLNFALDCEASPDTGIESDSAIHNLEEQIAEAVADQYDADSVVFDAAPTAGHGVGFAVTSEGVLNAIPDELNDLSDVDINSAAVGEALVWNGAEWVNGTVSTVGSIDDLNDVDTTGKANADSLRYNATAQEWEAKPTTVEMTLAEYTALGGDYSGYENTNIIITDAPNLNATAQDISYDGGADTVYDEVESLKNKEFYKVRITQVVIPSKTCTANVSNQLLDSVDIKTLTYDALDNISGFSETLIGAVFLWSNGGAAYATDTLVLNGKLTLYVCPNASSIITKIRLLTFWR